MTRSTLSSANRTEIQSPDLRRAWCVKFGFPTGARYCTTADRALVFGGQTYLADGCLLDVIGIREGATSAQDPVTIVVSGADASMVAATATNFHFSEAQVFEAFLDEGHVLVGDPHDHGAHFLSHTEDLVRGKESVITWTAENVLWALGERADPILVDGPSQKLRYAGDTIFDYVATIMGIEVNWGGRTVRVPGGAALSGGGGGGNIINLPTQRADGTWRPA